MVEMSNALIQPWAVVIEFQNAAIANRAMMSSRWFRDETFLANAHSVVSLIVRWNTWISSRSHEVME